MKLKLLATSVVLFLFSNLSFCAVIQGCRATANGGTNSIYYVRDGFYNVSIPQFKNDNFKDRYFVQDIYCYTVLGGHGSCYIQGYNGPASALGTLVSFSTNRLDCPLDDYIWLLILPLGAFGFHFMRKRSLLNLS